VKLETPVVREKASSLKCASTEIVHSGANGTNGDLATRLAVPDPASTPDLASTVNRAKKVAREPSQKEPPATLKLVPPGPHGAITVPARYPAAAEPRCADASATTALLDKLDATAWQPRRGTATVKCAPTGRHGPNTVPARNLATAV